MRLGGFFASLTLLLAGCGNITYYAQQTQGHLAMLSAARPVSEVILDPQTPAALKSQLQASQRIRAYASDALALPRNASYTRYADLKRPALLWNVVATPALSLSPKQWCFIIAGCVSYRGYYDKVSAEAEAAALKAQGLDVALQAVPAYSALGKLSFVGSYAADPLLNTFITYPEGELARLVFHELSHQIAYASDDSTFNESFATAVEQLGVTQYLTENSNEAMRQDYARFEARRHDFRALLMSAHQSLRAIYQSAASDTDKLKSKAAALQQLQNDYAALKTDASKPHWRNADGAIYTGYDRYFAQGLNNAHLAGIATYEDKVPAFVRLFEREGRDYARFYARVKSLAALPKSERDEQLK